MQQFIQRSAGLFSRITAGGASLSMIALFVIVFFNAVRRYTIGKSLAWGEEMPIFIAVYGVMFGMAWAYIQDRHIRFTMLVGFIAKEWTKKLFIVVDVLMVINGALLTYSGWLFMMKRGRVEAPGMITLAKQLRDYTGIDSLILLGHQYPYQSAMVLGGILLTIAAILKLLLRLTESSSSKSTGG